MSMGSTPSASTGGLTLDDVTQDLRQLRLQAGRPSYAEISKRIAKLRSARTRDLSVPPPARATVYDCFRTGRRRLDIELVVDIVRALGEDVPATVRWRQRCLAAQQRADAALVVTAFDDLPDTVGPFVGRTFEVDSVLHGVSDPAVPHVITVEGMPGSGKSYLAASLARRLRDSGRVDGILRANLRGFHRDAPPADPAAVLEVFLRLLGVPGREIPSSSAARRDLVRDRLDRKRHIIILDDASNTDQVRPLLIGATGSITVITSRIALTAAPFSERARHQHLELGLFSEDDAVEFLRRAVGPDRVVAEDDAARDLVQASGYLPLAIAVTATRVASRVTWSLADHHDALLARRRALGLDDPVEATIGLSYAALPVPAQTALRHLAAQPCTDLDAAAISDLAGFSPDLTRQALGDLVKHHLVETPRHDRYGLHALVRSYAQERSYDDDRPVDRTAAMDRLGAYFVTQAWSAHEAVKGSSGRERRDDDAWSVASPGPAAPTFDADGALAWFASNVDNLLTIAARGPDLGKSAIAVPLSESSAWWLNRFGRFGSARLLHQQALDAARLTGDTLGEARACLDLGKILVAVSDWEDAETYLTRAQDSLQRAGDLSGAASALNATAIMMAHNGRLTESINHFEQALDLAREVGDSNILVTTLDNLAISYRRTGRLPEALDRHREASDTAQAIGDRVLQATALVNMSDVELTLGRPEEALRSAQDGLELGRAVNNRVIMALAATNIGNVYATMGDHRQAVRHHHEALDAIQKIGHRHLEASIATGIGTSYLALDRTLEARRHFDIARSVSVEIGDTYEQARALDGMAHIHVTEGSPDQARECWAEALGVFEELGSPEAADVRKKLTALAERLVGGG